MQARTIIRGVAFARAAFGAALTVKTTELLRLMVKDAEPKGSLFLFARTVGIRDLVLGVGTLMSSFGNDDDLRRWVGVSLASDTLDTVSGAASSKHVGVSGSLAATGASIPFVAAGWWSLRRLSAPS